MLILIGLTTLGGLAGLMAFIYYFSAGQFDEIEDTKYQMFREEEEKQQ